MSRPPLTISQKQSIPLCTEGNPPGVSQASHKRDTILHAKRQHATRNGGESTIADEADNSVAAGMSDESSSSQLRG